MVEGIRIESVSAWLSEHVPGLEPPLDFALISGGRSNLTYKFSDARSEEYVLRRPPLGHVLESAHDMAREHRIVSALADTEVPVPPTLALCEDIEVNDAPFYIMKYIAGLVPHDYKAMSSVPESERYQLGLNVVDVLCKLHAIDPDEVGLGTLGRKEAYIERQLKRWTKQWEATKTEEHPEMDETLRLLHEDMPTQIGACIVHGDYRLGNMIVGGGRMLALLDWELCTLGDPLADVGYTLNRWIAPGEPGAKEEAVGAGGLPSRDEFCDRYEAATDRSLAGINYYRAFSYWRLAAIAQGVYKRYLVGAMGDSDLDLESYRTSVKVAAANALRLLTA